MILHSKHPMRRGALVVYGAFAIFLMLIMAAIAIDVAYIQLVRTELRTATDAASAAGCEALGRLQTRADAVLAAKAAASANTVADEPLLLNDADVQIGTSRPDATGLFQFTPVGPTVVGGEVNSVRVDGRRDASNASGRVQLFMGGILDTEFFAPRQQATSASGLRDVGLVLDRSGSMAGQKIEDLKSSIAVFFDILATLPAGSVQCSLTTYATEPTLDAELTDNMTGLRTISAAIIADGKTNIGDSLRVGASSILGVNKGGSANARAFANKAVVLLTDGNDTTGNDPFKIPPGQAKNSVRFCVDNNIPVFTIAFGADADQTLMRQIAEDTGGFFRDASNGADLEEAFRDIAAQIAVLLVQ